MTNHITDPAREVAASTPTRREQELAIVAELKKTMQCNCDLDNWEQERSTGHSHVCRIHKAAIEKFRSLPVETAPVAARTQEQVEGSEPVPTGTAAVLGNGHLGCIDCRRQYGDEFGFPDLVIDNESWKAISPNNDEGGLLCPSCICKRLHNAGLENVAGVFRSGPLCKPTPPAEQPTANVVRDGN